MTRNARIVWGAIIALLVIAGGALITVGVLQRTVWLPDDEITVSTSESVEKSAVFIMPGVLAARDGQPVVTVTARDKSEDIALVWGREIDADAWFEGLPVERITGFNAEFPEKFVTETPEADAAVPGGLPDVRTADIWVETFTGTGTVRLDEQPSADGRWVLAAVTNGTTPGVASVAVTWPLEVKTPYSGPLMMGGAALLLGAGAVAGMMRRRIKKKTAVDTGEEPGYPWLGTDGTQQSSKKDTP